MANSASSEKRIRQNERNLARNKARKSALKTATRKLFEAIHAGDRKTAGDQFVRLQRQLDQVAAKGTLHKNTAARRKSRLARKLNALAGAKTSAAAGS